MKNCEPLVSLPRFAIDSKNGLLCFMIKFSSTKKNSYFLRKQIFSSYLFFLLNQCIELM